MERIGTLVTREYKKKNAKGREYTVKQSYMVYGLRPSFSKEQRAQVVAAYAEGYRSAVIAENLGIPLKNVQVWLWKEKKRVREESTSSEGQDAVADAAAEQVQSQNNPA